MSTDRMVQSRATVLVVDDNHALLHSIERLLRLENYDVWLAADGDEALHALEHHTRPPDLIISDIAMPRMDGFQFYQAVREHDEWLRIPFVFLTARDQRQDLEMGYLLGADDYLIKPLDQERLLLIIRNKIERYRELMRHIDRQRDALAAVQRELSTIVAHELRTPLVSITMISEMLSQEFDKLSGEQVRDMLDMMQNGSVRMNRLVEQMVFYVQLQSGALEDDIRNLSKTEQVGKVLASGVTRAQRWDYRERRIPVAVEVQTPDAMIVCEPMALSHAISEVVHNAIMFSRPESAASVVQQRDGQWITIAVTDSGQGLPDDVQARVYEPFFQHNRAYYEQQGVGIGLTLAERILAAHGGGIDFSSRVGSGTCVTLSLPVNNGSAL